MRRRPIGVLAVLLVVASVTGVAVADHDGYEPNDDLNEAPSVEEGSYADLHVADGESDFYAIDLAGGEALTVELSFSHDQGDLDLRIYDPDRSRIGHAGSVSDGERATVTAEESGTYYVEVYGFGSASNSYDMDLSIGEGLTPDEFEPNDDHDQAAPVDDGSYADLTVVNGESDFYAVDLVDGQELAVDVLFRHDGGDLDLRVYDPERNEIGESISLSDDEHVTVTADEPGTHYVEVYGFRSASNEYRMDIARSGGATPTPSPTASPTRTATDAPTMTADDAAGDEASDGGGDDDGGVEIDVEVSPGFEMLTAGVALLTALVLLRRR